MTLKYHLIIRHNEEKGLVLYQNIEKVFFLELKGEQIYNSFDYEIVSNYFNKVEQKGRYYEG